MHVTQLLDNYTNSPSQLGKQLQKEAKRWQAVVAIVAEACFCLFFSSREAGSFWGLELGPRGSTKQGLGCLILRRKDFTQKAYPPANEEAKWQVQPPFRNRPHASGDFPNGGCSNWMRSTTLKVEVGTELCNKTGTSSNSLKWGTADHEFQRLPMLSKLKVFLLSSPGLEIQCWVLTHRAVLKYSWASTRLGREDSGEGQSPRS